MNAQTTDQSLVWGHRIRVIWRVLVSVLVGFLALRLAGIAALAFDPRGIPVFVTILAGSVIVFLWTRRRNYECTTQRRNHLTHSRSD